MKSWFLNQGSLYDLLINRHVLLNRIITLLALYRGVPSFRLSGPQGAHKQPHPGKVIELSLQNVFSTLFLSCSLLVFLLFFLSVSVYIAVYYVQDDLVQL